MCIFLISKRTLEFIFQVKVIWKVKCNNWSNRAQIECHMAGPHALPHEIFAFIYIYIYIYIYWFKKRTTLKISEESQNCWVILFYFIWRVKIQVDQTLCSKIANSIWFSNTINLHDKCIVNNEKCIVMEDY